MITKDSFKQLLKSLDFKEQGKLFSKHFPDSDCYLKADLDKEQLIYPEDKGFKVNERQTCNFSLNENFVVFECVYQLLKKGYKPEHIELEQRYEKLKKDDGGGRADIIVKDNDGNTIVIIECKTSGGEFKKHWEKTLQDGDQLFRYLTNKRETAFLCLYSSDFIDGSVIRLYHLVSLVDNESYLKELNQESTLSFKDAKTKNKEDIFRAWQTTYKNDYATAGLFEDEIEAYSIGKNKFTLSDLSAVSSNDIQGKYHEFATILRQHNVSGRENAFDKLVNLFLCKVVDEAENSGETPSSDGLKFYWKGIAYDNPFDLQDRLSRLYKTGMKEFLNQDITYIDNQSIDDAFRYFENDPDATRDTIKSYFRQLKFFTNNDFAFIDVHNEELFYKNFEMLLKIVRMLQDIRLSGSEQNQFLGDMFEGFLDQGVKQSEGQFFTPMPIVKFILSSLPIENLLKNDKKPRVIDFACGAGHFLNEYAQRIKPLTAGKNRKEYYANITGIEKEYRLSKVAKVSAFMYGQDEIKIVYDDALSKSSVQRDDGFDILVANPPYSVKGFLETLSQLDKEEFELIKEIDPKSYLKNNSIECFFLERAKQLLKPKDGIAAIILPSSILTNTQSKLYTATREILLKYFDIVAIADFGSGTFGKTGTNTSTLFLRRKAENPSPADHYKNRVDRWFEGKLDDTIFEDLHFIRSYCEHCVIDYDSYIWLLKGELIDGILEHETFKEYVADFEKQSDTKSRRKTKTYQALSEVEKQAIEKTELTKYIKAIESDKLYFYILASQNRQKVVIVKSPAKTKEDKGSKEIKKFLGYWWSSAKGNEGIKYIGQTIYKSNDDSEFDEEDARILNNIANLNNIQTPLYNPQNLSDSSKINTLIAENFSSVIASENHVIASEARQSIPLELEPLVSYASLIDLLDFDRKEFNKAFSLTPKKNSTIETKWDLVKLSDVVYARGGNGFPETYQGNSDSLQIPFFKVSDMNSAGNEVYMTKSNNYVQEAILKREIKAYLFEKDTIVFPKVGKAIDTNKKRILGLKAAVDNNIMGLIIQDTKALLSKYLFEYFTNKINLSEIASSANPPSISAENLGQIKIPLPPLDVQQAIANECEAVDAEVAAAQTALEKAKESIISVMQSSKDANLKKLGEICEMKAGKFVSPSDISDKYSDGLYPCYGGNGQRGYTKTYTHDGAYSLIGRQGALCGNITFVQGKFHATEHAVIVSPKIDLEIKWLYHQLIVSDLNQYKTGVAQPGLSVQNLNMVQIPLPPIATQKALVAEIEKLEESIAAAKTVIASAPKRKNDILKKYL